MSSVPMRVASGQIWQDYFSIRYYTQHTTSSHTRDAVNVHVGESNNQQNISSYAGFLPVFVLTGSSCSLPSHPAHWTLTLDPPTPPTVWKATVISRRGRSDLQTCVEVPDNVEFLFSIWNLKFFKFFQNVVTGACPQYSAEAMLILITDLSNKDKKLLDVQEQKFQQRETSTVMRERDRVLVCYV